MKFWCHDQRELNALLRADLKTEQDGHFRDLQLCAVEKARLDRKAHAASTVAALRAELLADIEVACQRAQRAGSHIPVREIFDILDRRP